MSVFPTAGQRTRVHGVLVQELVALRDRALARDADPAAISAVFRHRANRLRRELSGAPAEPVPVPLGDGTDYSVWW